ncbi:MAG: ParA family protein [Clostridia bacterium]|nr:ParA family protein [Clostridia bacterium]
MSSKPYVIAFANQKGGVGKTTSAINIASCVAEKGYRVLMLDCDPQGNTTSGLGINKKKVRCTMYDVLIDGAGPEEAVIKTKFNNLSLVPSTINLAGAEFDLMGEERRERRVADFIEKLGDSYDFVMMDCPPSLGMLTVNALTASNGVIIPMQCEYFALEGLSQLMISVKKVKERYNPSLSVLGILITMYNGRLNLASQVLSEIKRYYSDKLFSTTIPRNVTLSEAPGFGEPINYHDKCSKGAKAYGDVADELIRRTVG